MFLVVPTITPIVAVAREGVYASETVETVAHHEWAVRRLRSPIAWFGGKGMLVSRLLPLIPPHHTYVEPFCGGASCLFAKAPSPVEVINDLNSEIVNFFRVLRDPTKFGLFHQLATLTPYSREEFLHFRADWRSGWSSCPNDVVRAYRWYVVARMSFAGEFGRSWGYSVAASRRGMANAVSQWLSILDMLPAISERVRRAQVEHGDWRLALQRYDTPDTLFYVDPPFVKSTRRSGRYAHELDDAAHMDLIEVLLHIRGKVLLSGYRNDIYAPLEEVGWERVDLPTVCYAVGRTRHSGLKGEGSLVKQGMRHIRTESVWVSPTARMRCGIDGVEYTQAILDFDM